jgi:hypothetical protein
VNTAQSRFTVLLLFSLIPTKTSEALEVSNVSENSTLYRVATPTPLLSGEQNAGINSALNDREQLRAVYRLPVTWLQLV